MVVLPVVAGEFAVAVVGDAGGGAGSLVGAVGQDENLAGETGWDESRGRGPRSGRECGPGRRGRTTGVCRPVL